MGAFVLGGQMSWGKCPMGVCPGQISYLNRQHVTTVNIAKFS